MTVPSGWRIALRRTFEIILSDKHLSVNQPGCFIEAGAAASGRIGKRQNHRLSALGAGSMLPSAMRFLGK
jgi:hypothetical protein